MKKNGAHIMCTPLGNDKNSKQRRKKTLKVRHITYVKDGTTVTHAILNGRCYSSFQSFAFLKTPGDGIKGKVKVHGGD